MLQSESFQKHLLISLFSCLNPHFFQDKAPPSQLSANTLDDAVPEISAAPFSFIPTSRTPSSATMTYQVHQAAQHAIPLIHFASAIHPSKLSSCGTASGRLPDAPVRSDGLLCVPTTSCTHHIMAVPRPWEPLCLVVCVLTHLGVPWVGVALLLTYLTICQARSSYSRSAS